MAIDTSTSMMEPSRSHPSKLAAAGEAARSFLDRLDFAAGDQAAIVGFSAAARVWVPLTSDADRLALALGNLEAAPQTCLPCAVERSVAVLGGSNRRPENSPVVIVLTDGRSNPRPASEAVALASRAKEGGVTFFTIGLGHELEREALRAIASGPGEFFEAPNAADLTAIYEQISVELPCPPHRFWGRR